MIDEEKNLTFREIVGTWWPLAASWLMMGFELPAVSAVMARMADPEINLAAYGGVVFPIALLVEAPIIMILAASTALSRNRGSYERLRNFMLMSVFVLTGLHVLIAFTPLYYLVVDRLMGVPREIQEPARIGLMILTPWTAAIGYRRFLQGVLIRFGRSGMVGAGTGVRLATNVIVLTVVYLATGFPGIVVGSLAVSLGVTAEAVFAGIVVRPVLRDELPEDGRGALSWKGMLAFYIPLAITPLIALSTQPVVTSAMSRMPRAIDSLAIWPVLNGMIFTLRSVGFAFNEVVVLHIERPGGRRALGRFALFLGATVTLILVVVAATPLARFWFGAVSALSPTLVTLGTHVIWIALLLPAASVSLSFFQGQLVNLGRTRSITESVVIYTVLTVALLAAGVRYGAVTGIFIGVGALLVGNWSQVCWLAHRVKGATAR